MQQITPVKECKVVEESPSRPRGGLEELDVLGEALLKKNLPVNAKPMTSFQKPVERVPLNVLAQQKVLLAQASGPEVLPKTPTTIIPVVVNSSSSNSNSNNNVTTANNDAPSYAMDFDLLIGSGAPAAAPTVLLHNDVANDSLLVAYDNPVKNSSHSNSSSIINSPRVAVLDSDVSLLDTAVGSSSNENSITGSSDDVQMLHSPPMPAPAPTTPLAQNISVPPLADICIQLQDVKPSAKSPITLLDQTSGLTVTLHSAFAQVPQVSPSITFIVYCFIEITPGFMFVFELQSFQDVSVFVVSTTSRNTSAISNYAFQAVVPKVNVRYSP